MRFPSDCNTLAERAEYAHSAQEQLRLAHNEMGKKFRDGVISQDEWDRYRKDYFNPRSAILAEAICMYRDNIEGLSLEEVAELVIEKGKVKSAMKKSKRWKIDIEVI